MTIEKISSTNLNTLIKKTIQIPIEDNFICLRSLNPKRTRFEVEYSLEKGSCTNSFLFKSSQDEHSKSHNYILIHPPGLTFEKEFLDEFETLISSDSSAIKLVMGHINPNKVAFVKRMNVKYKNLTVYVLIQEQNYSKRFGIYENPRKIQILKKHWRQLKFFQIYKSSNN